VWGNSSIPHIRYIWIRSAIRSHLMPQYSQFGKLTHFNFKHCAIVTNSKICCGCKFIPRQRSKELMRYSPVVRCLPQLAQFREHCANFSDKCAR
jgi:hypothetical protein